MTTLAWTCTACGAENKLPAEECNDLEVYCPDCGKRHYITTVATAWQIASLEDADAVDEAYEDNQWWNDALTVRYPCISISHDGGKTWHKERINAVEFNPVRNLTIRPGDLVIDPLDSTLGKIVLRDGLLAVVLVEDK